MRGKGRSGARGGSAESTHKRRPSSAYSAEVTKGTVDGRGGTARAARPSVLPPPVYARAVPRPLRLVLLVLAGIAGLAVLLVAAYFIGRAQCPPPGWWVALFAVDGNWACVA